MCRVHYTHLYGYVLRETVCVWEGHELASPNRLVFVGGCSHVTVQLICALHRNCGLPSA